MRRRGWRLGRWLIVLSLLLVGACVDIPTSGPVVEIPVPDDPAGIEIAPQPPRGGDEPAQIVEGFLLAMANPESDFAVARAYLAGDARERWDPLAVRRIYEGSVVEEGGRALVRGRMIGSLDSTGRFSAGDEQLSHDFGLVEEQGQWRIAAPPEGVLVSRYLFERFYAPVSIYFLDPTGRHVVPDQLIVPEAELTPETIVRALMDGPSSALVPVVTNAVPSGVSLGAGGATIDSDGVVTVEFANLDQAMDAEARRRLGAQLLWSLTAIPRTTGLRVTSNGWPFALPGQSAAGVLELATQQSYSVLAKATAQDLYAIVDGRPGVLGDSGRFVPLAEEVPPGAELAVSLSGEEWALVGEDRASLWVQRGADPARVDVALSGLRDLQWVSGTLYGLGEDASGRTRLLDVGAENAVALQDVALPEGTQLEHMSINPSGGSAAVILSRGGNTAFGRMTLTVAGSLTAFQSVPLVAPDGAAITDFDGLEWSSESSLVVLARSEREQGVFVVRSDGSRVEELASVEGTVVAVAALPRQGGGLVALLGDGGTVWIYSAPNRWSRWEPGATALTYAS